MGVIQTHFQTTAFGVTHSLSNLQVCVQVKQINSTQCPCFTSRRTTPPKISKSKPIRDLFLQCLPIHPLAFTHACTIHLPKPPCLLLFVHDPASCVRLFVMFFWTLYLHHVKANRTSFTQQRSNVRRPRVIVTVWAAYVPKTGHQRRRGSMLVARRSLAPFAVKISLFW